MSTSVFIITILFYACNAAWANPIFENTSDVKVLIDEVRQLRTDRAEGGKSAEWIYKYCVCYNSHFQKGLSMTTEHIKEQKDDSSYTSSIVVITDIIAQYEQNKGISKEKAIEVRNELRKHLLTDEAWQYIMNVDDDTRIKSLDRIRRTLEDGGR